MRGFGSSLRDSITKVVESEVDTCVLLSGGLDSSLVTAYASQIQSNINTYSVSFGTNSNLDESQYSSLVANHFSTNHTSVDLDSISSYDFIRAINSIDDPFIDSSYIASYLLSEAISKSFKVAIGGDGADELLVDMPTIHNMLSMKIVQLLIRLILINSILFSILLVAILPLEIKGRAFLERTSLQPKSSVNTQPYFFDNSTIYKLLKDKSLFSPNSSSLRFAQLPSIVTSPFSSITLR